LNGSGDFSPSPQSDPFGVALEGLRKARSGKIDKRSALEEAIDRAILAEREIPFEQEKFDQRIKDERDEVWREYLCYQRDLIECQLCRARDT
jgi:hypothetical protein